ncbi:MAG: hypothetical protein WDZ93_00860 [Candidatus Paceibacterota bacterium]
MNFHCGIIKYESMRSLFHFFQYHNGAVLLAALLIGFGGTALAANELLRDSGEENPLQALAEPTHAAVDTSLLRTRDITDMDFAMRVVATTETESGYLVTYAYTTLAIKDGMWQEVEKVGELNVSHGSLTNTTLERHVLVQLGEVLTRERQFLARAQEKAREQYALQSGRNLSLLSGLSITEDAAKEASEENLKDLRDAPPPLSETEPLQEEQEESQQQGTVLGTEATSSATTTSATSSDQTQTGTAATSSDSGTGTTTSSTSSPQQSSGGGTTQTQTNEQAEGESEDNSGEADNGEGATQSDADGDAQQQTQDATNSQESSDTQSQQQTDASASGTDATSE